MTELVMTEKELNKKLLRERIYVAWQSLYRTHEKLLVHQRDDSSLYPITDKVRQAMEFLAKAARDD